MASSGLASILNPSYVPGQILVSSIEGRDGSTPKFLIDPTKCIEALNVDWFESAIGRKRNGAAAISLTGGTEQTGVISTLLEHVPTFDQSGRELWSVDDEATPVWKRLAGGTAWANVTPYEAVTAQPWNITSATFNHKLFVTYKSGHNRLHVWDGSSFRRAGLPVASVVTAADHGSGSYANIVRYYKTRWINMVGGVPVVCGELSTSVQFTPSGSGLSARVTAPAPPGECETHWEVYASPDNANFFLQSQVVLATTTYDDTTLPYLYVGAIPPPVNAFICPPSAKYLVADLTRLVMAAAWETSTEASMTPTNNRVWWTSPLGATNTGDDERVSNTDAIKNYTDVPEDVVGLGGPMNGSVFIFSYNGVWRAIGTPVASAPYAVIKIAGVYGCIDHKTIITAEDEDGNPCLYWLSPIGPVRLGSGGFQRCHQDIDDIWRTVNLSASTRVAHGVFHRDRHQIWWWIATGTNNEPDTRIVFDTRLGRMVDSGIDSSVRKGWAKHTGPSCAARCSATMSDTLGVTMSRTLKPHIGYNAGGTAVWKCDTGTTDGGTAFQSYVNTRVYTPWGIGSYGGMQEQAVLVCGAQAGVTIQLQCIRDRGAETLDFTLSIAPFASESHVIRQFDASRFAQAKCIEFIIGDAAAVDASWNLDVLVAQTTAEGPV